MRGNGNFHYLLAALVGAIASGTLVGYLHEDLTTMTQQILFSVVLLLGLWTLAPARGWFLLGLALAGLQLTFVTVALAFHVEEMIYPIVVNSLVFCGLGTTFAANHVFGTDRVDRNRIVGALCIYMMMGVMWALLYHLVMLGDANAFTGLDPTQPGVLVRDLTYYSFVTLTTLGYGDMSPVAPAAKTLAYLQAVTGQFYLTVLVAELVGTHVALRHSRIEGTDREAEGSAVTAD